MKNKFKKVIGAVIASSMLMSMVQTSFAATTFDSGFENQGTLELANTGDFAGYTYEASYVEGASGKAAGDTAYKLTAGALPYSFAKQPGFLVPFYRNCHIAANNLPDITTMEMSVKVPEGNDGIVLQSYVSHKSNAWGWDEVHEFVKIINGKIYVHTDNGQKATIDSGITVKSGEWVRLAVEQHSRDAGTCVYVNGNKIATAAFANEFFGNRWTQLSNVLSTSNEEGARNVELVVDDVKIYDSAYDNTNAVAAYTVDSAMYFEGAKKFFVNASDNATVGDILATVTADNKCVISSLDGNAVLSDTDKVSDGNVVVIKSADGKTFEYICICTDPAHKIKDTCTFEAGENYRMFGETVYAGRTTATGMFAKGAGDISDAMYVKDLPAGTESANRYNFMYDTTGLCSVPSFTREFSVAADGDVDEFRFIMYTKYGDGTMQYQEPIIFYEDGRIEANHDRILFNKFKKNQWYRVAITVYPQSATYDLYLNNELVVENAFLSMQEDHQVAGHSITNIDWFQIQPFYYATEASESVRNGNVYVDDTVTYYGTYNNDSANEAALLSDAYTIDEYEGTIEIKEAIDIFDFVDNVDFGNAIPAPYTDNTYAEPVEDTIAEGNVIVLASPNGNVYKYYTVKYAKPDIFEYDEAIKLYVNGKETATLEAGNIKAEISAHAPVASPELGTLIIAVYKDGELEQVKMDPKTISGDTDFSVNVEVADIENVSVKAMFWNMNDVEPYVPYVEAK